MELVAPAGNVEKLRYVYQYGADTAYIGLKKFSLRVKADNFYADEYNEIIALKQKYPGKRLFCALNIAFHNKDIDAFLADIDYFKKYPIDAFIIQDVGMIGILQKYFADAHIHVSTQANCINREAVKFYHSLGLHRVVLGREASLKEVREIKDACPEMEIEVFAHGAMCIAYAGRCLLSAYTTGRSANAGLCSHGCRWEYKLLEEKSRPGEYFPIFEGDDYTAILSSKDICMIDHLDDMQKAGVDALKIEGRMKSLYYGALVTRAYRKQLDALAGIITQQEAEPFVKELYNTQHREFATGFYYNKDDANKTTSGESSSPYELIGTIGRALTKAQAKEIIERAKNSLAEDELKLSKMHPKEKEHKLNARAKHSEIFASPVDVAGDGGTFFVFKPLNKICANTPVEFVGPDTLGICDNAYALVDAESGLVLTWVGYASECLLYTHKKIEEDFIVRTKKEFFEKK